MSLYVCGLVCAYSFLFGVCVCVCGVVVYNMCVRFEFLVFLNVWCGVCVCVVFVCCEYACVNFVCLCLW